MAEKSLIYIAATLLQTGADVFFQAVVATGLSGQTKTAFRLRSVQLDQISAQAASAANTLSVTATTKSFAAAPVYSEKSLAFMWRRRVVFQTGAGFQAVDGAPLIIIPPEAQVLVATDNIYLQLSSTTTAVANSVGVKLGFEEVTMSEIDRLSLLLSQSQ
jgi:hypothetical protein